MKALEELKREHQLIRRVLERARRARAPLDLPVLRECIAFFYDFFDRAHARKEEQVLFVSLEAWAQDLAFGPVRALQKEHNLARAYLRAARTAIQAPTVPVHLIEAVTRFGDVMEAHLRKEDEVLFELARIVTPPAREAELFEAMEAARREVMSDEAYAHWVAIAEDGARDAPRKLRPSRSVTPAILDARSLATSDVGTSEPASRPDVGDILFDDEGHRAVMLHDHGRGLAVQANPYLIVDDGEGMILDPGGPKVYPDVFAHTNLHLRGGRLRYVFLSHQDPDVGTSLNAWLMDTEADALVSILWSRFIPHFGLDKLLSRRLQTLPDEGRWLRLGRRDLLILPGHFLHSCGNLQVYDPTSKILFSGDLGASIGVEEHEVQDFESHRQHLEPFHRRYMGSTKALRAWARMARALDIEVIAPQHGALFRGREMVGRFLEWCEDFECGIDALEHIYRVPPRPL